MLIDFERETIEKILRVKVTNRYGCEEVGLIACECEHHEGMPLNIDHLYVEIVNKSGLQAGAGEPGDIIVTDLINKGMPLIRYRVEDVGVTTDRNCPCGRGLPLLERIVGRVADFLIKKDGTLVAGVSLVERTLTAIDGIEQMQIVQDKIDQITLNIVTDQNYNKYSRTKLLDEFLRVFGNEITINIMKVDHIPQEKSGKYRFAICNVNSFLTNRQK